MDLIYFLIGLPFISGIICFLIPKRTSAFVRVLAITASLICCYFSFEIFTKKIMITTDLFIIDTLSIFIIPSIAIFGVLIILYSLKFIGKEINQSVYYSYILLTIAGSFGVCVSNNLILFAVFWGFLAITLYLLISVSGSEASDAAKKTLVIIGGSDALMILGIAILCGLTETFQMDKIKIGLKNTGFISVVAFLCLLSASIAKAGAIPLHTWIPDMAAVASIPVTAFLPASLDKLLGIYLLARLCINLFTLNTQLLTILMLIGAITIIAAVFMAMIQHNAKRLLSYHAVSQVGYMVLGIGTGNPVGIAGGIFHMLNNAIYKCCLFLCSGSVEYRTKTSELSDLGGLSKFMPVTFVTCLIAALSISGVPPFNGFVSKWMIYQGVIQLVGSSQYIVDVVVVLCLIAAMFGSALTLASFMKLIHTIFLGQGSQTNIRTSEPIKDVHWSMLLPQVILAWLCVIFGVFAFQIPLKLFIFPSLNLSISQSLNLFTGLWEPGLATTLLITGLIVGALIYLISKVKIRTVPIFIGGKELPTETRITGVEFYQTIKDIKFFKTMYNLAEKKMFDVYDLGRKIVLSVSSVLSVIHAGNLHVYLVWCLVGIIVLLISLVS